MIYVAKPRKSVPRTFLQAAREEMSIVLPLFRRSTSRKPSYKFKAYRNKDLVSVLQKLFNQKCAYCEALYAATGYVEIEHYRPKSTYYWLAADWSNLLPACKRCNNGKLSKFPLADPRKQAKQKGQERREMPLLLNPSDSAATRRPERHLTFDPADGAIRPTLSKGQPSKMGETSIQIYRLTRVELSLQRKAWVSRVKGQIAFWELASRRGTAAELEMAYQGLRDLLLPTQPFRALTLELFRDSGIKR